MKHLCSLFALLLTIHVLAAQDVVTQKLLETTCSWDGKPLPKYPQQSPKVTILKITLAPEAKLPIHQHPVINCAVVTKGELKVVKLTGEERVIKAGEAIAEVVGSYHYGLNTGKESVELIVFYAGDENTPLSVKQNQP